MVLDELCHFGVLGLETAVPLKVNSLSQRTVLSQ